MSEPSAAVLQQLRQLLGDDGVRVQPDAVLPDVVLRPQSTEQVSAILQDLFGRRAGAGATGRQDRDGERTFPDRQ